MNKVTTWINQQDHILIDSSMSTGLEERGLKLNSNLWTAAAIKSNEDLIVDVHKKYFDAGSSMTTTNTYQASVPGLVEAGYSEDEAITLIKKAVELADRGRNESTKHNPKWLLGGIGPYGAFLANGSEYTGDYSLTDAEYIAFHKGRIKAMVEAGIDVLILETFPNINELKVITKYTKQFNIPVIVSVSLKNKAHLADGSSLIEIAAFLESQEHVIAYGLNCTKPQLVTPALNVLKQSHPDHKPFIAFPNSGATYNPSIKEWNHDDLSFDEFDKLIVEWFNLDLKFVGGCCCMTEAQEQHIYDKFFK